MEWKEMNDPPKVEGKYIVIDSMGTILIRHYSFEKAEKFGDGFAKLKSDKSAPYGYRRTIAWMELPEPPSIVSTINGKDIEIMRLNRQIAELKALIEGGKR